MLLGKLFFMNISVLVVLILQFHVAYAAVPPANKNIPFQGAIEQVQMLLDAPENEIDLLDSKLVIDKILDPRINVDIVKREINAMVPKIKELSGSNPTELEKVLALRKFLYDSGDWNDEKPFSYDLEDPFGQSKTSRLLHNYLRTRKGNCVSMPILHAILGQKIGLNMTLSTAPLHVFVKFTNEQGNTINIEATSGGYPARDAWYQEKIPMTDTAVRNGVYMKKLSNKESVVVIAHDLASLFLKSGDYEMAIKLVDVLVLEYSSDAPLYTIRGSAHYKIIEKEFYNKYPTEKSLPHGMMPKFQNHMHQNKISFQIAELLGWRDPDEMVAQQKKKDKTHMTAEEAEQFRLQIEAINRQNGAMMPFVHSSVPPRQGVSNPISAQPRFPTSMGLLPYPPNPNGKVQPFK